MKGKILSLLLALFLCTALLMTAAIATETEATTEEDTSAPTIISSGTQYHPTNTTRVEFTWELDSEGTLTFYKGSSAALQTASNGTTIYRAVETWRGETTEGYSVTNENLVKTIVVAPGFNYIRNQHNAPKVILGNWPELTKIIIPNDIYLVHNWVSDDGFFQKNPKLTTLWHSGTSDNNREGVINMEKITRVDGKSGTYPNFEKMFYNCPSITEVILPPKNTSTTTTNDTYQMFYGCTNLQKVNFPVWMTSIGTGMFYNCVSLEELSFPTTVTSISASALTGCTGLKSLSFANPELTIPEGMVIPDNEGLIINCSSVAQATAINALGLTNAVVNLELSGNFLADGTGYNYVLSDGVLTISAGESTSSTVLSSDVEHGLAGIANTVVLTEESGITAVSANFFDGWISDTVVIPSTLTDLSAAGVFANMANLTTVVDYTAYSEDSTAGEGVINLLGIGNISDDCFSGSSSGKTVSVYLGKSTAFPGTAFNWFASDAALTYYVYPTSASATYLRNSSVAFSYLTVEQTGDSNLVRSGTAVNTNSGNNSFDWSFDESTGVLTYSKGTNGSSEFLWRNYTMDLIKPWKQTWRDAVKRIVVTGFTQGKIQRNHGGYESPFNFMPNLESVHIECFTSNMMLTFYTNNYSGWFEGCPKLTTVSYGSDDTIDNVIDLSNWSQYTNGWFEMFKGCSSITNIIFPATLANKTSEGKFPPSVFSGMFDGCTSLTSMTLPSYFTNIEANGFANCTNLREVVITNPDLTIADASAFPDVEGLIVVCASEEQYNTITSFGYEHTKATLTVSGNLLAAGNGFAYMLRENADTLGDDTGYTIIISASAATEGTVLTADNIPEEYLTKITEVIIDEGTSITEIGNSFFEPFTSCHTIVIPSTVVKIGARCMADMSALNTVALYNDYYEASFTGVGVIDLRNVTTLAPDSLEGAFAGTAPMIYLAKTAEISGDLTWISEESDSVTIYTYPSGTVANAVRKMSAANVIHKYYTTEMTGDETLVREGAAINGASGSVMFRYSIDELTGKVILTPSVGAEASNSSNLNLNADTTVWQDWKKTWTDAIESIFLVNFGGTQIYAQHQNSWFSNLPNLKHVHIDGSLYRISMSTYGTNGLFQNCPSLTTVSYGSDDSYDEVIDLSFWRKQDYNNPSMFRGCTSIKKVIMPELLTKQASGNADIIISNYMFYGCTSLEEIVITEDFGGIGTQAFAGCTGLKKVVIDSVDCDLSNLSSATFPANEDLVFHTFSDDHVKILNGLGYNVADFSGSITAEGFKIRYKDYNGLRGIFSFSEAKNDYIESFGYELKEYGVILTSKTEYDYWGGIEIRNRYGEYTTEATAIKKLEVYKNGSIVGKILPSTVSGEKVDFAGSLVKYSANHTSDLYIGAYIIYVDANGYEYIHNIFYEDSAENKFFNLYDMTLDMYKNHEISGILSADVDEKAVWNTLLQGADTEIYESTVGGYAGITLSLIKDASSSTTYIPFLRSESGTVITDEIIAAAEALITDSYTLSDKGMLSVSIADQGTTAPAPSVSTLYAPTLTTPNRYPRYATPDESQIYGAQHLQGMTMDDDGSIYYSFTGMIVKVNQQGEEVGVYKVANEWTSGLSMHVGNIYWHEGKIYIGLGLSNTTVSKHKRYIGVLDDSVFDVEGGYIQDSNENPLLKAVCIEDLSYNRTFTSSDGVEHAKFGGGGIDGITVGQLPGKGYILPAGYTLKENIKATDGTVYTVGTVLTEDVEVTDNEYYLFGVRTQGSYDTYRFDDDTKQIMAFDFDDIIEGENLTPFTYERAAGEYDGDVIKIKFNMFVYNGYHEYGCQVICYDKSTGDILMWPYDRANKCNEFPDDNFMVIDGSKKLYMGVVEVGQSVPETSEYYSSASDWASCYKDEKDLDNDGDTTEPLLGWHMTLRCICGKGDIENHEAVVYGDTGYAAKICGLKPGLTGDNGCIHIANDFFYIAAQSNGTVYRKDGTTTQTAYGAQARLYSISRYHGKWTFNRISSW